MNTATSTPFDTDELLHLAIQATERNQTDKAIEFLKQVLALEPKHGTARYFLGAVHAGLGMYERAIADMSAALDAGPNLPPTAPFQLGMLYMTTGQADDAERTWAILENLAKDNPLFLFKRGMLHLAKDEFAECVADLQLGISLNDEQEHLNRDIQGIIERAEAARAASQDAASSTPPKTSNRNTKSRPNHSRSLLSAYQHGQEDSNAS
jgi:tetratricopeptide (TPR) repeat protein